MRILFVTCISARAGSGLVISPSSMARVVTLAPGLEAWAEMCTIRPPWTYALYMSFDNLFYDDSNLESRCRKRHKFRTSIGSSKKGVD